MAPTRHYFPKAVAPLPKPKRRRYGTELVMAESVHPLTGKRTLRTMMALTAAKLTGAAKGGRACHRKRTGHRWTSKQASRMAKRLWRTRFRFNKLIQARIGAPSKRRRKVKRAPLRAYYALHPTQGLRYEPTTGQWRHDTDGVLSERAALTRLGYLPPKTPRVAITPSTTTPIVRSQDCTRAKGTVTTPSTEETS